MLNRSLGGLGAVVVFVDSKGGDVIVELRDMAFVVVELLVEKVVLEAGEVSVVAVEALLVTAALELVTNEVFEVVVGVLVVVAGGGAGGSRFPGFTGGGNRRNVCSSSRCRSSSSSSISVCSSSWAGSLDSGGGSFVFPGCSGWRS